MIAWIAPAFADDVSVTSVGAQGVFSPAVGEGDVDLLFAQRGRWEVEPGTTLRVDGRFSYDPQAVIHWEESSVQELGAVVEIPSATLYVGRHPIQYGGPRLVDGVQALVHPDGDRAVSLGGWAGLVPDEFTTAPLLRPGFGPVLAVTRSSVSASLFGEIVFDGSGLARAGGLVTARAAHGRIVQADARADVLATDGAGHAGLVDGAISARVRPVPGLKLGALYEAYSSLLYQSRADLDPTVQRYTKRSEELGLVPGITEDLVDPTLHHLVALDCFGEPPRASFHPRGGVRGRLRWYPDPEERYASIGPEIGLRAIADRLDLTADVNVVWLEGRTQGDAGIVAFVDLLPEGAASLDGSFRILFDPIWYDGDVGLYGDLFADVLAGTGSVFSAGVSWTREPSDTVGSDVGFAGYFRFQQWIRPRRDEVVP